LTVVTIGARDLAALRTFYQGLGWPLAVDLEDFAAFETGGAVLTLFPLTQLAAEADVAVPPDSDAFRAVTLAVNVDRPEQVDAAIAAAAAAGARVTREPVQAEWGGRSAYFADPEGNLWEVAWVPPDSKMAKLLRQAVGQA
jgi:catechol 2,3-dioxygenase-like lactoylglutathione lyase family enzyme